MANQKSCFINFIGLSNWELDQLVCMCHALACNKLNYDHFALWFISAKPNTWWLDHGGNLSPMAWPTLISWIFSSKTRLKIAGINNLINWLHYNFISYWIGKQQKEKAFLIQLLKNRKLDIKMILFFFAVTSLHAIPMQKCWETPWPVIPNATSIITKFYITDINLIIILQQLDLFE